MQQFLYILALCSVCILNTKLTVFPYLLAFHGNALDIDTTVLILKYHIVLSHCHVTWLRIESDYQIWHFRRWCSPFRKRFRLPAHHKLKITIAPISPVRILWKRNMMPIDCTFWNVETLVHIICGCSVRDSREGRMRRQRLAGVAQV